MSKREHITTRKITFSGTLAPLAIGVTLLLIFSFTDKSETSSVADTQKSDYHYGTTSLVGATSEQIGQYAVEIAQHHLGIIGIPQVMLSQPITDEERPALGLGCPPSKFTIEDVPQAVVILKGDFDITGAVRGNAGGYPEHIKYIAYVFDEWSANYTSFAWSLNGGRFKSALNDPTIASDNPNGDTIQRIADCPTPLPFRPLHYGEVAPTVSVPTYVPPTEQIAAPSASVPSPVATYAVK